MTKEPNNLKEIRKTRGLTLQELADLIGTSYQQIMRLEKGERRLSDVWLTRLSEALNCSMAEILGEINPPKMEIAPEDIVKKVPAIKEKDAAEWVDTGNKDLIYDWIRLSEKVGRRTFALRIAGDNLNPEFTDGSVAIVEPSVKPKNGYLVVAVTSSNAPAIIRRYLEEGEEKYLLPLNPMLKSIEINENIRILGTVTQGFIRYT